MRQDTEAGQAVSEVARDAVRDSQVESCHPPCAESEGTRRMGTDRSARSDMTQMTIIGCLASLQHRILRLFLLENGECRVEET